MNANRFVAAIIVLAVAALLATLNAVLPPEELMFTIGDENMPFVPVIVLAIAGVWLLVTAMRTETKTGATKEKAPDFVADPEKVALNKRLETVAWGLFLIMLGGFMLVPHELVAGGVWSIGVGLIMLGLNGARYLYGLRMSGFTTFLGILSLITGTAQLLGFSALDGPLFLIILGAYLILKPWFDRKQLFGKVQEG